MGRGELLGEMSYSYHALMVSFFVVPLRLSFRHASNASSSCGATDVLMCEVMFAGTVSLCFVQNICKEAPSCCNNSISGNARPAINLQLHYFGQIVAEVETNNASLLPALVTLLSWLRAQDRALPRFPHSKHRVLEAAAFCSPLCSFLAATLTFEIFSHGFRWKI